MTYLRVGAIARIGLAVTAAASLAVGLAGCGLLPGNGDDGRDSGDEAGVGRPRPWQQEAEAIEGIVDYTESQPDLLSRDHMAGSITYEVVPPVGGPHNDAWQQCLGNVYDAAIADEHAVHSLEHGAVWVTYHPSLPADQVTALADQVQGTDMLFMSPYPELDAPVSLQAWGYQLKLDTADDPRIDEFIRVLRVNASQEPGATCAGGVTATGTEPAV